MLPISRLRRTEEPLKSVYVTFSIFFLKEKTIIKTPRYLSFFSRDYCCYLPEMQRPQKKSTMPRHQKLIVWSFSKGVSSNNDTKTQRWITDARGAWLSLDSGFSVVSIFAGEAWVSRRTFFAYSRGALWTYDGTLATYEHRVRFWC